MSPINPTSMYQASLGNDDDPTTYFHTSGAPSENSWWLVRLENTSLISGVTVLNRHESYYAGEFDWNIIISVMGTVTRSGIWIVIYSVHHAVV